MRTKPVWISRPPLAARLTAPADAVHGAVDHLRVDDVARHACERLRGLDDDHVVGAVDVPAVLRRGGHRLDPLAEGGGVDPARAVDPPRDGERQDRDRDRDPGERDERQPGAFAQDAGHRLEVAPRGGRPGTAPTGPTNATPIARIASGIHSSGEDSWARSAALRSRRAEERHDRASGRGRTRSGTRRGCRARTPPSARCAVRPRAGRPSRRTPRAAGSRPAPGRRSRNVTNVIGIALPQPAHLAHVLLVVHPVDHRAGAQEHQRLVERVRDQEEHRDRVGAHPDGDEHVAELADRRVREHTFDVELRDRAGGRRTTPSRRRSPGRR